MDDKSFRALRESGAPVGASRSIGAAIASARDQVARVLIWLGATPNRVTLLGFALTCAAAWCLVWGASHSVAYYDRAGQTSWWPAFAALFLFLAGACDMLDGAVARVGGLGSRAGAVFDSTIDRLSDMVIYVGCLLHFALLPKVNLTYQLLAILALSNGVFISYVKARAENLIDDCSVGYWLRGERVAAVLIGCATGHVPAVLWQMAISGSFTAWRRIEYAYHTLRAVDAGRPPPPRGPVPGWLGKLQVWRYPRGSIQYDVVTGLHIAFIVFAPLLFPALRGGAGAVDPVRHWLGL
jgi:CDP-diacylglycerol--glycerol-3-phosphate 3-phosphatidyltransferase